MFTREDHLATTRKSSPLLQLASALALVTLLIALLAAYAAVFPPRPVLRLIENKTPYDPASMYAAVSPDAVARHHAQILALGSRFSGQPGFYQTADLLQNAYKNAGLELTSYQAQSVAPRTLERRLTSSAPIPPALEIYPFFPALQQPMNSPPEGLSGKLVLVTDHLLLNSPRLDDCIALIEVDAPPTAAQLAWTNYARLGFRAVIFAHRKNLASIPWRKILDPAGPVPVNFIRLAATPAIFDLAGQPVTLHVRTRFEQITHPVLLGTLRAPAFSQPRSALIIPVSYDAPSFLPDLAEGQMSAVPLATHLALLEGLSSYRSSFNRDIIFLATGTQVMSHEDQLRLLAAIGPPTHARSAIRAQLQSEIATDTTRLQLLRDLQQTLSQPDFLTSPQQTLTQLASLPSPLNTELHDQLRFVINSALIARAETKLQAFINFRRAGEKTDGPEFAAYRNATIALDDVSALGGLPLTKLLRVHPKTLADIDTRSQLLARTSSLIDFHTQNLARTTALLSIHDALNAYSSLVVLAPEMLPALSAASNSETLSPFMGEGIEQSGYLQYPAVSQILSTTAQRTKTASPLRVQPLAASRQSGEVSAKTPDLQSPAKLWNLMGYPALSLVHIDRPESYEARLAPTLASPLSLQTMAGSLRLAADTSLWLARGNGSFREQKPATLRSIRGRVFASGIGQSVTPTHALPNALWMARGPKDWDLVRATFYRIPVLLTDPYGRYSLQNWVGDFPPTLTPDASLYDSAGHISWIKDQGANSQLFSRSVDVVVRDKPLDVNLVAFRADPITIFDLTNPQTFAAYPQVKLLRREGLTEPHYVNTFRNDQAVTTFVEPDQSYVITFQAGSPDNPSALQTHAFMLGRQNSQFIPRASQEVDGAGFLAADSTLLHHIPRDVAQSMLVVNQQRLTLQNARHMADARTNEFQKKARTLLDQSHAPDLSQHQRTQLERDSATYSILNHPVLRGNIRDAVLGLLWYLALLVPFALFFEKLAFGYSDIRRQLLVQALVILIVFALLKFLHPAFEMIRSSLMILLGFVILLICSGVTLLLSTKFKENLAELRKNSGHVAAAEINTLSVVGTAFMIGLNNMHRRKVRTALTCATLVLLTFAMICFTSTSSDITDTTHAVGRAGFQGFLVKNPKFRPVTPTELFGLRNRYGSEYNVVPRYAYVGQRTWDHQTHAPKIEITSASSGRESREPLSSILVLSPKEPLQNQIKLLTSRGFLPAPGNSSTLPTVLIPDTLARSLSITPEAVNNDPPTVRINSRACRVWGIFDSQSLADLRDLDAYSLLPFDTEAVRNPRTVEGFLIADETDARVSPQRVVLTSTVDLLPNATASNAFQRLLSVAVDLQQTPYKKSRAVIDQYLEQSGRETAYGIDGVSYIGQRSRQSSFVGLSGLLLPLAIAGLTVLNTMRASVYERKDEIFVFNSVGIAPRYIFFMFFAEAFVYAVVGAVLGYLLSQGIGRILTDLNLTGGLVMTFTSLNTVFASIAVMIAVFFSTLFPALSAMRLATPSDSPGWDVPDSADDRIQFPLPFTFDFRDRVAVLEFFRRVLADHGEGSAGIFYAKEPAFALLPSTDNSSPIPQISAMIWLKPFDLGVSQRLTVSLPNDPETSEFIALVTLERVSGTREAWMRLNRSFITAIRQHFLYWRAVDPDERADLFAVAKLQLLATTGRTLVSPEAP